MSLWNDKTDPNAFPAPPAQPALSRQACLSPKGLRSFLALSRHSTDDVLRQRLNSLLNARTATGTTVCEDFAKEVLFPSWRARLQTIEYCSREAELLKKQLQENSEPDVQKIVENSDLRIDPYAQREVEQLKESKYRELTQLENWCSNEMEVENIVQRRSEEILNDTSNSNRNWVQQYSDWIRATGR